MTNWDTNSCYRENDIKNFGSFEACGFKSINLLQDHGSRGRIAKPYSWTSARKISDLFKIYGYDGQDDEQPLEEFSSAVLLRHRTQPSLPRRPRLQHLFSSKSSLTTSSRKLPDRFLPSRASSDTAVESFRANKDPRALSPSERLTRNDQASSNPFGQRRRVALAMAGPARFAPRRNISGNRSGSGGGSVLTFQRDPAGSNGERQVSVGTVWRVGGLAPINGISDGRGGLLSSGTNAPLYTTIFSARPQAHDDLERMESRVAEALELDRTSRIFDYRQSLSADVSPRKTRWNPLECQWISPEFPLKPAKVEEVRTLPLAPFKVLDAPNLRDDFYCSVLAYSATCHTLAVGLGPLLYAWSEIRGVHLLNAGPANGSWLTSLSFSSTTGKRSILAFGRSDGSLSLMSLYDSMLPRFEVQQPCPVACITWRPQVTMRSSRSPGNTGTYMQTEDLLVGDEVGNIYYYAVEWPEGWEVARNGWSGAMTLLARISVHSQQICGLSFSRDGALFATGGNDNLCFLFRTNTVLHRTVEQVQAEEEISMGADGLRRVYAVSGQDGVKEVCLGSEKHRWVHGAAVKAIAFCPWKEGLLATGGGSNDKCIHFYHATSGTCLATISVSAQVTSLIWSNTRREICATFGYAQPEHPYRIAVFSWPECKQVAAIPWDGEHRALYAIPYPGGPNESHTSREGGAGLSRTAQEGCIVVASSDESVKFHEVWTGSKKTTATVKGLLGGSDVIEGLESIDKEGEIIR